MGLSSYLRKVYDLDTLDTRFTSSTSVPYQTVIDARDDPAVEREAAARARSSAPPPKWRTPEFFLYYIVFIVVVPYMFWVAYDVSRPSDPRYSKYEKYLSEGWIPGRKIDNSDAQYRTFRGNFPIMTGLLIFHPLLRKGWESVYKPSARGARGSTRLDQRATFDFIFAIVFIVILHGISSFKILAILSINYQLATKLPRKYVPAATWIFNIGTLFANELTMGYRLQLLANWVGPPWGPLAHWGYWLDRWGGILTRWDILFNITILRLISFNLDYYWSIDKRSSNSLEKKGLDPASLSERDRISIPADIKDFSFRNYVAYALYAPLYIAGPIITFNDYISQSKYRAASIEWPRTIRYGVRFLLVLLAMELILHYDYVGAISKAAPVWSDYTAAQLSLLSFFNLHIIWLKLLLPWRMFRLWALVDGIDPPENMVRCVSNNYSTQLFWRAWHRSYNRWLIRYIYIPLGGSSFRNWQSSVKSVVTYLLVFTFVALWHDIKLRLLIWGWLIVIFMVPEWTASYLFPKRKWESRPTEYRMLCCIGAVGNVLMMISANLVGFAVGLDGLQSILSSILHDWSGVFFILTACICLFVGVQVMFEIRESEKRKGVVMKC
ncbi:glycerol:H+ symporter (Gup1), putative [Trichoderma parareesei]|uniref:Glycerol:H+ symporter (Gup1), putative n=1 Tax=Trichoderma parareesei TaxID=858221 RepID=A0A2H2ZAZ7_TRIPA|nr:glycerol:H+ symporter (Gup1), putative [Trichoderma parareesei]